MVDIPVPPGATSVSITFTVPPVPPPSPPPGPTPSPEGSIVTRGQTATLVDAALVSWGISPVTNGAVLRAGALQTATFNVASIQIVGGKLRHKNDAGAVYEAVGNGPQVTWTQISAPPVAPPAPVPPPPSGAPPGFTTLVYSDDFDGTALKPDWVNQNFGPQHRSNFRPANVSVANSLVSIKGTKLSGANGLDSEGGWIETANRKFDMTKCYAEARLRVGGAVNWNAAFWMYGGNPWPSKGEFDILELLVRSGNTGVPLSTLHMPTNLGGSSSGSPPLVQGVQNFHVYGGSMKGGVARWYVDGVQTRSLVLNTQQQAFFTANPQMLMICLYCDSAWTGGPAGANTVMDVDWVKVWQ